MTWFSSDRPRFLSLRRLRGLFHWSFACLLLSTHDCCQARESWHFSVSELLIRNWKLLIRAVLLIPAHCTVWRRLSFPSSLRMRSGLIWLCSSCLSSLTSEVFSSCSHLSVYTGNASLWRLSVRHIRTNVLCVCLRGNEIRKYWRNIPPTSPAHWCRFPQCLVWFHADLWII